MRKDVEELWTLADPTIVGAGLELVELEWNREPEGWVLRVFIDRPRHGEADPNASVTFEDCERVSRDLSAALDVADVIPHTYRLEVSSPGLDRPLRRLIDFARFTERRIKVRTVEAVEGRRNFSGTIHGVQGDAVVVECDGRRYQIPVGIIARAHLVPDWDAEFRRKSGEAAASSSDRMEKQGGSREGASAIDLTGARHE